MLGFFVPVVLLVIAGFALGLVVGRLAWTSTRSEGDGTPRPDRRPTTTGLPQWQVRRVRPTSAGSPHHEPWSRVTGEAASTVFIGPQIDGRRPDPSASSS